MDITHKEIKKIVSSYHIPNDFYTEYDNVLELYHILKASMYKMVTRIEEGK